MEKIIIRSYPKMKNIIRIVLSGPESTGKTWLAKKLAEHYNTVFIPEFAREYVENLNRDYSYNDVEIIARKQIEQISKISDKANNILFIDTWLVITKVWFQEVYARYPRWLITSLESTPIDLYLLCNMDIDWEFDPVRENPDNRDYLFNIYKKEIEELKKPFHIITGKGDERFENTIKYIDNFIN